MTITTNNTSRITGTVQETILKDKYSQVILNYYLQIGDQSKEQKTPFTAMNSLINEKVKYLQPGKPVTIEFQTGGKEANGKFFANNLIVNIIQ